MSSVAAIDFGFDPTRSPHHFVVLPVGSTRFQFLERFAHGECLEHDAAVPREVLKAELDGERWQRIRDEAADVFNTHLRAAGFRTGAWRKGGPTLLAPHLGRELLLLVWATEGQDLSVLPAVRLNWRGFAPEERWWLYSTINASSRHPEHAGRGWRKAIKIALAENPLDTTAFIIEWRASAPGPRPGRGRGGDGGQRSLLEAEATQPALPLGTGPNE
ncbi:MAG: DUF3780 domain-containing protein [Chloroflexota bacterium]